MTEITPFQLSRLYASGWRAGMSCPIDASLADIEARAERLNPRRVAVERARWMQGFTAAVRRKLNYPGRKDPQFRISSKPQGDRP
jgi:hypothetical protein